MNSWKLTTSLAAILMGFFGVYLSVLGNPENSGICISCFMESTAGGLGLHDNLRLQYIRPELIGFIAGSFISALFFGEFKSRSGSAPLYRFLSGFLLIVGCAVFIGCPIKMFIRFCAGDLSAIPGVAGVAAGVWIAIAGHKRGLDVPQAAFDRSGSGILPVAASFILLILYFAKPDFIRFSEQGGSVHAPWYASLFAAIAIGFMAQRSRFCITGSIRDILLTGVRTPVSIGLILFLASSVISSIAFGRFNLSFYGQPGSHTEIIWSFLGMFLVGWISVIIGGCPFRQLVKAGEGDADAALAAAGMLLGGAIVQSAGIASTSAGVSVAGKVALLAGLMVAAVMTKLMRVRL